MRHSRFSGLEGIADLLIFLVTLLLWRIPKAFVLAVVNEYKYIEKKKKNKDDVSLDIIFYTFAVLATIVDSLLILSFW